MFSSCAWVQMRYLGQILVQHRQWYLLTGTSTSGYIVLSPRGTIVGKIIVHMLLLLDEQLLADPALVYSHYQHKKIKKVCRTFFIFQNIVHAFSYILLDIITHNMQMDKPRRQVKKNSAYKPYFYDVFIKYHSKMYFFWICFIYSNIIKYLKYTILSLFAIIFWENRMYDTSHLEIHSMRNPEKIKIYQGFSRQTRRIWRRWCFFWASRYHRLVVS